jgi:hypothetical protein
VTLVLLGGRCQGYDELDVRQGGATGGDAGTPAPGAPDALAPPRCEAVSLGASPRECADTFAHSAILYPSCTDDDPAAGDRARCGVFGASILVDRGITIQCFYDPGTGNLALSLETGGPTERCLSYDPTLSEPPPEACTPLGAAACTDAGL